MNERIYQNTKDEDSQLRIIPFTRRSAFGIENDD